MGNVRGRLVLLILMMILLPVHTSAEEIELQMDVGQPGCKRASFSVGKRHSWYIRAPIPENWDRIEGFSVIQTLSPSLTMETDSVTAELIRTDGEHIPLRMGEQYQMTAGSVFVEGGTADRLSVSLTQEGMDLISSQKNGVSEVRIVYQAVINTHAPMGTQILASAQLNLTDKDEGRIIFLSDKAAAATGGFSILLRDPAGEPIAGGKFMLAREATGEELSDSTIPKEHLDTGEKTIAVIYETFCTSRDLSEKTDIAVTDESGAALCYGLAYGTYYLVQTESGRTDYLSSPPVNVRIDEASHLTHADGWKDSMGNSVDNTVCVTNTQLVMPQTGGMGTAPYTASGMAVILCACMLMWYNRKRSVCV